MLLTAIYSSSTKTQKNVFYCKQKIHTVERMNKKEKYKFLIDYFQRTMPKVETELQYNSNFQLLVVVMLSAQCTDKRINLVTPALFEAYPDAESMARADEDSILSYIHSVSYPNSKAKHLLAAAKMLCNDYNGEVPSTMEELTKLPGVGRKTANVIQAVAFRKAAFAVDTHIFRVSHRLGLVGDKHTTPYSVELELTRNFPDDIIPDAHHWLLLHGRYVCKARTPLCSECGLKSICKTFKKK